MNRKQNGGVGSAYGGAHMPFRTGFKTSYRSPAERSIMLVGLKTYRAASDPRVISKKQNEIAPLGIESNLAGRTGIVAGTIQPSTLNCTFNEDSSAESGFRVPLGSISPRLLSADRAPLYPLISRSELINWCAVHIHRAAAQTSC